MSYNMGSLNNQFQNYAQLVTLKVTCRCFNTIYFNVLNKVINGPGDLDFNIHNISRCGTCGSDNADKFYDAIRNHNNNINNNINKPSYTTSQQLTIAKNETVSNVIQEVKIKEEVTNKLNKKLLLI